MDFPMMNPLMMNDVSAIGSDGDDDVSPMMTIDVMEHFYFDDGDDDDFYFDDHCPHSNSDFDDDVDGFYFGFDCDSLQCVDDES
jgi:hypothetical protein